MAQSTAASIPRCDFVLLFDVTDGNPNGDPDAGNAPRIDPETGHGLVTDVCIKRKIRNFISLVKGAANGAPDPGYDIYVREKAILNQQHQRAYDALKKDGEIDAKGKTKDGEPGPEEKARRWMCQTFFDIRMFGAVMSTDVNAGQVRGPVQLSFSRSVDPIISLEHSITRMAVTTEEEWEKQQKTQAGQARMMGRKETVPYALYLCYGFVNPFFAKQTGFSSDDLALLWQSLARLFENDQSASRARMATQDLLVFEHASPLGNAPAHRLFERVKVSPKPELSKADSNGAVANARSPGRELVHPPRCFDDYIVSLSLEGLPAGVKVKRLDGYELKEVTT